MVIIVLFLVLFVWEVKSKNDACRWSDWSEWSSCDGSCGGKIKSRVRRKIDLVGDCLLTGSSHDYKYCLQDCVRSLDYWKWHNKYAVSVFNKPWPISEDSLFSCDNGMLESRSVATWYNILIGHPEDDNWALLVEQYVAAILNIEAGANGENLIDTLNEARTIIEDCDGWDQEVYNNAIELLDTLEKFNGGKTDVPSCSEKPCCVFEDWEPWGECTKQCGGGESYRYQRCFCPAFTGGTPDDAWCSGEQLVDTKPCNLQDCQVEDHLEEFVTESGDQELVNEIDHNQEMESNGEEETLNEIVSIGAEKTNGEQEQFNNEIESTVNEQIEMTEESPEDIFKEQEEVEGSCYWSTTWGEWSECSAECDGQRTHKQICYCELIAEGEYDDTYCDGIPLTESESCNTDACITNTKTLAFWQQNNRFGLDDHYKPWPIPEDTKFKCDRGSDSIYASMTWFDCLNEKDSTDPWINLAKEYIVIKLNIESGDEIDSELGQYISESQRILGDCDALSDKDEQDAKLLTSVLSSHNNVFRLEELSTLIAINDGNVKDSSSHSSVSSTLVSASIGAFIVVIFVVFFVWRRNRSEDIVTYEPEFELPDADEEMIPSGIVLSSNNNTTYVYGEEEEDEVSYELGELDEVDL